MSMKLKKMIRDGATTDSSQSTDISGLKTDVGTLKTTVGKASGQGAGGIAKDVSDMKTAIGDEDTPASILGRIKALETTVNTGGGDS